MGLFSGIQYNRKKNEAAVLIQDLLEISQKKGMFNLAPYKVANLLVAKAWDSMPDVFEGKFGQSPHKLSIAAIALTNGIMASNEGEYQRGLFIALGRVLGQVALVHSLHPFNSIDDGLLTSATVLFDKKTKDYGLDNNAPSTNINNNAIKNRPGINPDFFYKSFTDWYVVYRDAAAKANKALCDVNGVYLLDMMKHEPLYRAFSDKVDPESLGKEFGRNFDAFDMKWDFDSLPARP